MAGPYTYYLLPEYRLQAEVVQGLQPRSHGFSLRNTYLTGLKALVGFRLKPVLRRDCPRMGNAGVRSGVTNAFRLLVRLGP